MLPLAWNRTSILEAHQNNRVRFRRITGAAWYIAPTHIATPPAETLSHLTKVGSAIERAPAPAMLLVRSEALPPCTISNGQFYRAGIISHDTQRDCPECAGFARQACDRLKSQRHGCLSHTHIQRWWRPVWFCQESFWIVRKTIARCADGLCRPSASAHGRIPQRRPLPLQTWLQNRLRKLKKKRACAPKVPRGRPPRARCRTHPSSYPCPPPHPGRPPVPAYSSGGFLSSSRLLACLSALVSRLHRISAPAISHRVFSIKPTVNPSEFQ